MRIKSNEWFWKFKNLKKSWQLNDTKNFNFKRNSIKFFLDFKMRIKNAI